MIWMICRQLLALTGRTFYGCEGRKLSLNLPLVHIDPDACEKTAATMTL